MSDVATDDLRAERTALDKLAEETARELLGEYRQSDVAVILRGYMRAAADARAKAIEEAAKVAEACYERNKRCPLECKCGDGQHIAMAIRGLK